VPLGCNRFGRRHAKKHMVAAANPLAARAGLQVLREGGSAVDAAIAIQLVLTLVEPQSSGIGGGAFLLHWDGQHVQAYDGRETAPMAASEDQCPGPDGRPLPFRDAAVSGLSVGVPGVLRMLERVHRDHGRLKWGGASSRRSSSRSTDSRSPPPARAAGERDPPAKRSGSAHVFL